MLEGGGQAYYELGVADSGALIGLSRADLEQSLETLEMMAGEIGASVIVVKEIDVPPAMVVLADKVSEYIDPETGEWTEKMVNKRARVLPYDMDADSTYATPSATDCETDTSVTDFTDVDEPSEISTPSYVPDGPAHFSYSSHLLTSNPERPTAQSSPFIAPIDDEIALFSMEPEPAYTPDDEQPVPEVTLEAPTVSFDINIEISSVYKPRPMRRRSQPSSTNNFIRRGVKAKTKERRQQPWQLQSNLPTKPPAIGADGVAIPNKQETKALHRRLARDKRREEKRKALVVLAETAGTSVESASVATTVDDTAPLRHDETAELVAGLNRLLVSARTTSIQSDPVVEDCSDDPPSITPVDLSDPGPEEIEAGQVTHTKEISKEPRLIVEALVVRKMSIEEAFLDFGGFSLNP